MPRPDAGRGAGCRCFCLGLRGIGTSAAAPHVAGVAALVRQAKPAAGVAELRTILRLAAVDLGVVGFDSLFGFGRADALNSTLRFVDVHSDHPFLQFIDALANAGVTAGCATGPALYCPDASVTRGQMSVFILKAKLTASFTPPPCTTPMFGDVPCGNPFAAWINELARRNITAGCGGGNYCPNSPVSRQEMAVFLIRARDEFSPPPPVMQRFLGIDAPCAGTGGAGIEGETGVEASRRTRPGKMTPAFPGNFRNPALACSTPRLTTSGPAR